MEAHVRRTAAQHTAQYRNYKAYLRGVEAAEGDMGTEECLRRKAWIEAIELVWVRKKEREPMKAELMDRLFNLSGMHSRVRISQLSLHFCCSPSCIYHWREQLLDALVAAAAQTGAIKPYEAS